MAALDANVLIRFVVDDDKAQADAVARLVRRTHDAGQTLFVPVTVLLESEWVLRKTFGFDKAAVHGLLMRLLSAYELDFESDAAVELALADYEDGSADFADYLHAALADQAGERPLWTFDKTAAKSRGAQRLKRCAR